MTATVLAIGNQKGGVGKTTTAISLASALSILDIPTLVVDMDPQGNATSSLGLDRKPGAGIYEPLLSGMDLSSRVLSSGRKNLWIVPSEEELWTEIHSYRLPPYPWAFVNECTLCG